MISSQRSELLSAVQELGHRYPEMRFGQLVDGFACMAKGQVAGAVYEVEDEELLITIRQHLANQALRKPAGPEHCHDPVLRQEIIRILEMLSQLYAHWRFGKLVASISAWAGKETPGNVYDVEDEDFLAAARGHLERRSHC